MLDPLTAFSLAASIIQFVGFAKELCSDGYDIYRTGKGLSDSNAELEQRILNVKDLEARVVVSATNSTYPGLTKHELKLRTLAQECHGLCRDILDVLEDLKVKSHGVRRAFAAARQSMRSMQKAKEVKGMIDRLDHLQVDVNTCLLLITRSALLLVDDTQNQN